MHAVGVKYALNNAKLMQMPEFTIPKKIKPKLQMRATEFEG